MTGARDMEPFRSILVDIDATAAYHPELDRAVRLARAAGAKLTIADVMSVPPEARAYLSEDLERQLVSHRRDQLENVARTVAGVPVQAVLLSGRPATALIREVLRSGHDLLVRSHARDLVARPPAPYGAINMELFRQCPCPVLVEGPGAAVTHPRILGAVHATSEDPADQALNAKIVELTLLVARLEQGTPMLLHAWEPYAEELVRRYAGGETVPAYVASAAERGRESLMRSAAPVRDRVAETQMFLRRGWPDDVIPEFAVAEGVDLVVMGSVARSGISGFLIGNTAERVLRKLTCSVLTVKPDDFVSPVRLEGPP
ncbi:MAG TPA: universal stress protein [Longimicrobiales bacterium]|nr:universal stress protein [Longimicrobiales bacterium]